MDNAFELSFDKHEAKLCLLKSGLMNSIKDNIRSIGLTQKAAAKITGVTQPRISDLIGGKISLFSFDMLFVMDSKIAELLK